MPSEDEYRNWKAATFGSEYMIWHDGLQVSNVQSLTGDARETALSMLHRGVELGDSHAAEALAAMGMVSCIPELRAQLRGSSGAQRVRVALAIHALSPDESLAKELIEVLEDASLHWGSQLDAAMGLRKFGDSTSERALLNAIEQNGSYLVRYHASNSLLSRWQVVPANVSQHGEIFKLIGNPNNGPIAADEQTRLKEATARLEKLHMAHVDPDLVR